MGLGGRVRLRPCNGFAVLRRVRNCRVWLIDQMPSPPSWGIGRAATLLKTLLQYYGKSLEALPGVAYPGFRDNRSTLNTKTGYKKYKKRLQSVNLLFNKRIRVYHTTTHTGCRTVCLDVIVKRSQTICTITSGADANSMKHCRWYVTISQKPINKNRSFTIDANLQPQNTGGHRRNLLKIRDE